MRKIAIDMTPLIDIVFQLLIFFVMTLNILPPEGDLAMQMPHEPAPNSVSINSLPPMTLILKADEEGGCSQVLLNQRSFAGDHRWDDLHNYVARLFGEGDERADVEVQIVADYDLPLVKRIGFAPTSR
jgi:biopolymer transport protein ExbD